LPTSHRKDFSVVQIPDFHSVAKDGKTIVILLIGSDKSTQDQDIARAKNIWQGIKNERK